MVTDAARAGAPPGRVAATSARADDRSPSCVLRHFPFMTIARCPWADGSPLYAAYHDREWGVPVHDDRVFFEFLILEGAQAGLSWSTILNRRDGYREAFAAFDPAVVARFDAHKVEDLLTDGRIVRNRLKIQGAVTNARGFVDLQREFGSFDRYVWPFVGGEPIQKCRRTLSEVPARTAQSDALARDLARRGFRFVGPTIMYAFMQATGLVNDHLVACPRRKAVQLAAR
jgi:DNA-3-methyladenine glycosylase I